MRTLDTLVLVSALVASLATAVPASAGLAGKCRKACEPLVAECRAFATSGKAKRACKKTILGGCKRTGLEACARATTSTTMPGGGGGAATTTTLPSGNEGGGVMFMDVLDAQADGDADPRTFTLQIEIEYGIVTADAVGQVALDPSTFSVVDETTEIAYPAEPASAPGDCSADDVVTRDGPAASCTLRFAMPLEVAANATLRFLSGGLHGSESWSLD
jgi:hypothetical protein